MFLFFFNVDHFFKSLYWICNNIVSVLCFGFLFFFFFFWLQGMWDLISPTRNQTWMPCIRRWNLKYWPAREIPTNVLSLGISQVCHGTASFLGIELKTCLYNSSLTWFSHRLGPDLVISASSASLPVIAVTFSMILSTSPEWRPISVWTMLFSTLLKIDMGCFLLPLEFPSLSVYVEE